MNLKTFALGALWAAIGALPPVVVTLWDDLTHYTDPVDWKEITRLAVVSAGAAVFGYYQKHKALLQPPPDPPATGSVAAIAGK